MFDVLLLLLLFLAAAASAAELHAVVEGRYQNLTWDALDGKLQEAPTPNGPWQTVTTAVPLSGADALLVY